MSTNDSQMRDAICAQFAQDVLAGVVLTDPDDPRFGALCPACGDYLGTMRATQPRRVVQVGNLWMHALCRWRQVHA